MKAVPADPSKRVLVVDDEVSITRLMAKLLERKAGYTVRVVNDPCAAVGAVEEFRPNVVLLDIIMPALHGGEIAALLEQRRDLRRVPILFISASDLGTTRAGGQTIYLGHPFIQKPVNIDQIIESIEKMAPWTGAGAA
jgi:CheY-like chemotaxis protein